MRGLRRHRRGVGKGIDPFVDPTPYAKRKNLPHLGPFVGIRLSDQKSSIRIIWYAPFFREIDDGS